MTRLMAMTFWGKERFLEAPAGGEADEAHASAYDKGSRRTMRCVPQPEIARDTSPVSMLDQCMKTSRITSQRTGARDSGHGHGAHIPHESPPSMWVPLVVLAVLATIGGFVGIGPAFKPITGTEHPGGRLNIVNWLNPIIWNPSDA